MDIDVKKLTARGRADYGWFICNCLDVQEEHYWSKMKEVADSVRDNERTAVQAGHGVSKAVAVETEVLTMTGFKRAGHIKQGDFVLSEVGEFVPVMGVSAVTCTPMLRVTFDDNSHIDVDSDHLWNVHTFLERKRLRGLNIEDYSLAWDSTVQRTTKELISELRHNGQINFSIPLIKPLNRSLALPNAYIVGLWLGDGTRGTGNITIGDKDIKALNLNTAVEVPSQRQENCGCYRIPQLRTQLRLAGILKKKAIPAKWLCDLDYKSRVALLQGFMDADGYKLAHGGTAAFGITDRLLYDGIIALIASLGVKVHVGIEHRVYNDRPLIVYKANFSPSFQPFRLNRKCLTRSSSQQVRRTAKYIVSIDLIESGNVCCLVVESERHLFASGRSLTITHNTYGAARIALTFLNCYYPSTVITMAPSLNQVKNLMWREIREAHSKAKIPLGGNLTTLMLDMQALTGMKWFAMGLSTRADTITKEATKVQGVHNKYVLIILDEAAGILPEIWRAIEHIGAPFMRVLVIGNATSKFGDFPAALRDPTWHHIQISVTDTPNFKTGKEVIPGLYGRKYEQRIRLKYGVDSDQYLVRVKGGISEKGAEGAYYGKKMDKLEKAGRISDTLDFDPNYPVYIIQDVGYTTAIGVLQVIETNVNFINCYEDSGLAIEEYVELFLGWEKDLGYKIAEIFVPCDMDSNATKIITGESSLETLRHFKYKATPLKREIRVTNGIQRTVKFLDRCRFHKSDCARLIECLQAYHEKKNDRMSTEDKPVFTGVPEKDGTDHMADMLRYASMAVKKIGSGGMTAQEARDIWEKHKR